MSTAAHRRDHPDDPFAENRAVYSANNGTSLPGTLPAARSGTTTDTDVNAAYDNTGSAYEAYRLLNRDSYDNAGAQLRSTVHYRPTTATRSGTGRRWCTATAAGPMPAARALVDVTAHALTHAVTENEANLVYSGEPGGLNEAMSDIFGAFVEAWVDGGKNGTLAVSTQTWLVGEDILPPFLRNMRDPFADGQSLDVWSSSAGNVDVHYNSGIANLAFYLLAQAATHPRGKTTTNVTGIGIDKGIRIFYKANTDILTSNSNFAAARTATIAAAQQLGYTQAEQDSVACAWAAVKVGTAPTSCGGTTPPNPTDTVLTNGVAVANQSGAAGAETFYSLVVPAGQTSLVFNLSGGTGDADMYVQAGQKPTQTAYSCRPYLNGNNETCTIANPAAGTYYVMLRCYTAYSARRSGTYNGGTPRPATPT